MNFLLIGMPNVGKTSIFNLFIKHNHNIIHSESGTTRDWHVDKISNNVNIYDTPGILFNKNKIINNNFELLIKKIDVFIYVIDYKLISYEKDRDLINFIRKYNKKIILIVNKDDNYDQNKDLLDLGIKDIFYLSCAHKYGYDEIYSYFNQFDNKTSEDENHDYRIAIYGKTNVGKSTLLNKLVGFKRASVSNKPKTTTDIVESFYIHKSKKFLIMDTAGLIKKNKITKNSLDFHATKKTFSIVKKTDLNIFLIDIQQGFDNQSKKIFNLISKNSNSILFIINKIDLIKANKKIVLSDLIKNIETEFAQIKNINILPISTLKNKDIVFLKNFINNLIIDFSISLSTSKVNKWLKLTSQDKPHPRIKGKDVKFKYATQISNNPLTIKIFSNFSKNINIHYRRYLLNSFNKYFKIKNKNIKIIFSKSLNPYN